jgi:hypothetical protein
MKQNISVETGFSKPIWDEKDYLERGCSVHGKIGDPDCLECRRILKEKVLGFI